ncbi:MAG: hypothetical protein E7623_04635 [Ruminococcaceae bacterium]|nr:hypothetical protein [Oscillospiraceae bacterium]
MSKMNCEQYKNIVFDHAEGSLENDLKIDADEHIISCASCRKEYEDVRHMFEAIKKTELIPDNRLYDSVMREVKKKTFNSRRFVRYASIAASLIVVIGVAFSVRYLDLMDNEKFDVIDEAENAETDSTPENNSEAEVETEKILGEEVLETEKDHSDLVTNGGLTDTVTDVEAEGGLKEDDVSITYYDYVVSEKEDESSAVSETCNETAANIGSYIYAGELAVYYVDIEYDTIDVFHIIESDAWEIAFYMADRPEDKCIVKLDNQFKLISVE